MLVNGKRSDTFRFRTSRWTEKTAALRLVARPRGDGPIVGEYAVSGLLDYTTTISFGESDPPIFRAAQGASTYPISIPALPKGKHCLVLAAVADPAEAVDTISAQDAISGLFYITVGSARKNYCMVSQQPVPDTRPISRSSPIAGGCIPNISRDANGLSVYRHIPHGTELWGVVPVCAKSAIGILLYDGVLQGASTPTPPLPRPPQVKEPGWIVKLPDLNQGGWNLLGVQSSGDTIMSQPVLIE
jgi:hypothetical protein